MAEASGQASGKHLCQRCPFHRKRRSVSKRGGRDPVADDDVVGARQDRSCLTDTSGVGEILYDPKLIKATLMSPRMRDEVSG